MKRTVCGLVLFLCLWIAGCSSVSNDVATEKKEKKESLTLWSYYETETQKKAMDELVEGFNESQDKYELTWEYHGPLTAFNKEIAISITQNQLPDMVIVDNPDMMSYIKMDRFEDISSYIGDIEGIEQYFPTALETVMYEGRYYGLPFCCNNLGLIYNKDMLEEAEVEVPGNWAEMVDAARKLTTDERHGLAISAIGGEQSAFQIGTFMLSAGDSLEKAGEEGTLKAFSLMKEFAEEGVISSECVNWSQNDVARTFIDGECAMMINGPWVLPALNEVSINYGVTYFPADVSKYVILGGEDIAVLKGKNVEGSIAFMKYYNEQNVMLNINLNANSLPPRQDVAESFLDVKLEYEVFMKQMQRCRSRASFEKWAELSEALSAGQYQVITGQGGPEEICQNIQNAID